MDEQQRQLIRKKRLQRIKRKRRNAIIRRMSVFVLLLAVTIIWIFTNKDELHGTWDCDGVTFFQFNGRGKGALLVPDCTYVFDYKIDEDRVEIDFEDEGAIDYTYEFSVDKEKLVLSGSEGKENFSYDLTKKEN